MIDFSKIRLLASDLDNTLLTSAKTISSRTRAALSAATQAGILLITATGRQVATLPEELPTAEITYSVTSNGAVGYHHATNQTLFTELLEPKVQAEIAEYLLRVAPGTIFGTGRGIGEIFCTQPEYTEQMQPQEFLHDRRQKIYADLPTIISEPTIKMIARHATLPPEALLNYLNESGITGFHATTSGAPTVEIGKGGVNKATGLARLCKLLRVSAGQTLAVGDSLNDIEMLQWASIGVAMANALPEVKAVTQLTTASNDEDGLAQLIETILAQRSVP